MACDPVLLGSLDLPRPGVAEDAPALAAARDGTGLLGVFDGLGGAGTRLVEGEDGRRSSAYYAARLARSAAVELFGQGGLRSGNAPEALSGAIGAALAGRNRVAPYVPGAVRSTLLRSYPTTAALLLIETGPGFVDALAMWAGDSRCYVLTPAAGLQQLSTDDSAAGADPMRALREDGPMTNVLTADAPARLHRRARRVDGPALFLAATDGSHSCLPSPMHFELMLLDALAAAATPEDWAAALAARLATIADDDVTVAAAFTGWASVPAAAASLAGRHACLREQLAPLGPRPPAAALAAIWRGYRPGYLALAAEP